VCQFNVQNVEVQRHWKRAGNDAYLARRAAGGSRAIRTTKLGAVQCKQRAYDTLVCQQSIARGCIYISHLNVRMTFQVLRTAGYMSTQGVPTSFVVT